uniref:Methyltransf_21 domain-containing protein n=1 Tax=Panagrellus redivivus TaxID=6233 RepID=A0A7E4UTG6_PANRE
MNGPQLCRIIAAFILIGVLAFYSAPFVFHQIQLPKFSQLRNCQLNGTTSTTEEFAKHYRECISKYLPDFKFEYFQMGRFNEKKVFLPLVRSSSAARNCIFLTIGIGGDIQVEQEFKQAYPECQVYGIEPSVSQIADFDKYGTVIPYGVGVENATIELTLRKTAGEYKKQNVTVVAMPTLLDAYLKTRFVHYATIDIEGAEFPILEALLSGKELYKEGVVICQLDAELHGFRPESQEVINLLKAYSSPESQYISVVNSNFLFHQKVTFVNFENEMCREAFNLDQIGL